MTGEGEKKSNINISFCGKKTGLFPTLHAVIGLRLVLIKRLYAGLNRAAMEQMATRDWRKKKDRGGKSLLVECTCALTFNEDIKAGKHYGLPLQLAHKTQML